MYVYTYMYFHSHTIPDTCIYICLDMHISGYEYIWNGVRHLEDWGCGE